MPRLLALAVAAVLGLTLVVAAGDAVAQPSPYGAGTVEPQPRGSWQDSERAKAWTEAEAHKSTLKEPERLSARPSGFWTSNRPARGGAYRWRIMAAGLFVLGITVFFVVRMLRRIAAARAPQAS